MYIFVLGFAFAEKSARAQHFFNISSASIVDSNSEAVNVAQWTFSPSMGIVVAAADSICVLIVLHINSNLNAMINNVELKIIKSHNRNRTSLSHALEKCLEFFFFC